MEKPFKEKCYSQFFEIYIKNPNKKITVSFLCSKLNISRQRFYNVFKCEENFKKELIEYIACISFGCIDSIDNLVFGLIQQIKFYYQNSKIIKVFNHNTSYLNIFITKVDNMLINNQQLALNKAQIDFILGGFIKIIYDIRFNNLIVNDLILNQYKKNIYCIASS